MYILPEPVSVAFDDDMMVVTLDDGRTIGAPLAWFPALLHATDAQRKQCELSPAGLHWVELDEDIAVEGLLAGRADQTYKPLRAA